MREIAVTSNPGPPEDTAADTRVLGLFDGEHLPEPGPAKVRDILLGHLEALHAFYGEQAGVRIARKHLGWYAKDRPENRAFLAVVNRAQTAQEQLRSTRDYFDALAAGVKPELPAAA